MSKIIVYSMMGTEGNSEEVKTPNWHTVMNRGNHVWVNINIEHRETAEELRAEMHRVVDSMIDAAFPVV